MVLLRAMAKWRRVRRPTIASLGRREAATAIDALPFLVAAFLYRHSDDRQRHRWDVALTVLDAGYTIGLAVCVGQTLGQRLVGIRVVDAQSLERPPWTRSAIRWAVAGLPYPLATLLPPLRSMLRLQPPERDVYRHRQHRDGDEQADEEWIELESRHPAYPVLAYTGTILTRALGAADLLLALRDPSRRGLGDRAARTIVVKARPGRLGG
jgi:uncharacterized RDD family membrane protein YckC